ncbi:MAG: PepSY domain-containing protein [bacterium]
MDQNENNKNILKYFFTCLIVVTFIGLSISAFNTICTADNDSNPYCSGDTDKIQELTDEFIQKYGEDVEIRWDEDTGFLEKILYLNLSGPGNAKDRAFSFLSENSLFLGIDLNDLELLSSGSLEKVKYIQLYKGIPVHKGEMWVTVSKEGGAKSSVTLKDYYFCLDVDIVPTITKEEAAAVVMENLGVTELFNTEEKFVSDWGDSSYIPYGAVIYGTSPGVYPGIAPPPTLFSPPPMIFPQSRKISQKTPASTQLLIYPKGGDAYLCWEFKFNQGEQAYTWHYYIDAHTGEIVYNYKGANYVSSSSGTTSSSPSQTISTNPYIYSSPMNTNSGNLFPASYINPVFSSFNSILDNARYGNIVSFYSASFPYSNYNTPLYYPGRYAFPVNSQVLYGNYNFPYSYNYSRFGAASSSPYPLLPSGIFNLLASSNLNTVQKGIELMHNYWPPF